MTPTKALFLFIVFLLFSAAGFGQEICDNGLDDDQDGLIDLNDDDCVCESFSPSSLIPNPSFEEMTCCPNSEADLNCAVTWIQASTPTTDYLHTCGITEMPFLGYQMPLPVPDGEGAIGFRDGKPGVPNFKEYAGACLTEAMTPGVSYMLDFFIGFHDAPGSMTFDMAIFATTNCNNLPFGGGNQNFGCPTNGPGWIELGAMTFSGENEWVDVEFEFMADQAYEAIVLGPACAVNPNVNQDPYFFFDDLVLAESSEFGVPLMSIDGNICEEDIVLTTSDTIMGSYQWYKDGIALIGETSQSLTVPNFPEPQGVYEVVVTTSLGCFNGEQVEVTIPSYSSSFDDSICGGELYEFGGEVYSESGIYEATLVAIDGCDSIVTLTLDVLSTASETFNDEFCLGDGYELNGETYNLGGTYTQTLVAENGCDSTLTVVLIQNSASEAIVEESACIGSAIEVNDEVYTETGYYEQLLVNSLGCDSFLFVDIQILDITEEILEAAFCGSSEYELNGEVYNESGTYIQTLQGINGCDSILTLNLSLLPVATETLEASFCGSSEYELNGEVYTESGIYMQNLVGSNGCDSLLTLNLSLLPTFTENIEFDICDGEVVEVGSETYSQSGTYTQELISSLGCDSTVIIMVDVLPINLNELDDVRCDNDPLELNGEVYDESGEYSQVVEGSNGCDSLITINLTLIETFQTDFEAIFCINDELTFGGELITEAGYYTSLLTAENGCDSLITLTVEADSTCVSCVTANAGDQGLSFNIKIIDSDIYDVEINFQEKQTSFQGVNKSKLESLATIFVLEKERLYQGQTIENCILFDKVRFEKELAKITWNKSSSISRNSIKSYSQEITDKQLSKLDDAQINGHYGLIMKGINSARIGSKFSFN